MFPDLMGFGPVPRRARDRLVAALRPARPGRPRAAREAMDGRLPASLINLPAQITGDVDDEGLPLARGARPPARAGDRAALRARRSRGSSAPSSSTRRTSGSRATAGATRRRSGSTSSARRTSSATATGSARSAARIVGEVLVGLLDADPESFRAVDPGWRPTLGSRAPASVSPTCSRSLRGRSSDAGPPPLVLLAAPPPAADALVAHERPPVRRDLPARARGRLRAGPGRPHRAVVGDAGDGAPGGRDTVDLAGRTLMPGLDRRPRARQGQPPSPRGRPRAGGAGAAAHLLAADLREALRHGLHHDARRRLVRRPGRRGAPGDALRRLPRPAPADLRAHRVGDRPGGRFFDGMYREADGPDEIRKAVREQLRRGADFVKVMTTGARSVELEDPEPAQLTRAESPRWSRRPTASATGSPPTRRAWPAPRSRSRTGIDTIEHGMYLNQRPDLLERMAAAGPGARADTLVLLRRGRSTTTGRPRRPPTWSPLLVELAEVQPRAGRAHPAGRPLRPASPSLCGHDWRPI